ncbi:hypothetical protein GCM10009546_40070 [Actinomadura livida]|uniref:DUF8094 domain-containing protein n=1 Tax=Actinomadura livida TaxID=79909 RepID=A0A7W7I9U9_9ACTN|nr:hypothetical protein [Actinomadura catellatispora]
MAGPAVAAEESLTVLREWAERHNRAVTSEDVEPWQDAVTGALEAPVTARARRFGKLPKSARISLANPVFYVPRQSEYPRWFGVAALERSGGGDRQVLGVFVKEDAAGGWRAAHWLTFKGRPPQLARDKEGYVPAVSESGLPKAHARYLGGDDDALIPDSYTSNARDQEMGDWTVERGAVTPGPGESYALRTEDGGALVWYAVKEEKTLAGGEASTLPEEVRVHLEKNGEEPGETVQTTWQWLVIGYAPESGKGRVLGESVSLVAAR